MSSAGSVVPLASVAATRAVLERFGLFTKHRLGQHFLINKAIVGKILRLAEVSERDCVLEVGPGIGTLTQALLACAKEVIAVERDEELIPVLRETCAFRSDHLSLLEQDALTLDLTCLNGHPPTKLVSNLPYGIAATVVLDYFRRFSSLASVTVMVQREVAERMRAQPGTKSYGAYTVKLSLYAQAGGTFSVGRNNFFPPPHVDSAVIRLDRRTEGLWSPPLVEAVSLLADAAFVSRRKTFANSCRDFFRSKGPQGEAVIRALPMIYSTALIDPSRRGETLSLQEFLALGSAFLEVVR